MRLLLVEDDEAVAGPLRQGLAREGYEVVHAASGAAALDAPDVDLVLLDLGLPDRDGLELINLIRSAGTAVLVVSARDATEQKVTALDLGADDYVTKPFDTEEVLARIRTALRHKLSVDAEMPLVMIGAMPSS